MDDPKQCHLCGLYGALLPTALGWQHSSVYDCLEMLKAEIARLNVVIETLAHYENEPSGVAQNISPERPGSPQTGEGA